MSASFDVASHHCQHSACAPRNADGMILKTGHAGTRPTIAPCLFLACNCAMFLAMLCLGVQVRGVGQPSWKAMPPLAALQHDLCSLTTKDDR